MKCSGENVILRGIFHVVSSFPLHFMLYRGNLDCFSNSVHCTKNYLDFFIFTEPVKVEEDTTVYRPGLCSEIQDSIQYTVTSAPTVTGAAFVR